MGITFFVFVLIFKLKITAFSPNLIDPLRKCTLYITLINREASTNHICYKLLQHVLFRRYSRCGNFLKHSLESLIYLLADWQGILTTCDLVSVLYIKYMDCPHPGRKLMVDWLIGSVYQSRLFNLTLGENTICVLTGCIP